MAGLRPVGEGPGHSYSDLFSSKLPVLSTHRKRSPFPRLSFGKSILPDTRAHAGFPRVMKVEAALVDCSYILSIILTSWYVRSDGT